MLERLNLARRTSNGLLLVMFLSFLLALSCNDGSTSDQTGFQDAAQDSAPPDSSSQDQMASDSVSPTDFAEDSSFEDMITPQDMSPELEDVVEPAPVCTPGATPSNDIQEPSHLMRLQGETSWFAGPIIEDLDGDGSNELIAAYYDVFVFDASYNLLARAEEGEGRIYAPHAVTDLDGDGIKEVVAGRGHQVWAWEWREEALVVKEGWPADTTNGENAPEVRGLAVADLDNDGTQEVAVTTTQTLSTAQGGAQVFVFDHMGALYQPSEGHRPAWPRYNALPGEGNDADRNGQGHSGFGCYGLNIGIGELDDDPELELVATYDNHHIQVFNHDGVAQNASSYFTNRASDHQGERFTWGQFIRWASPEVEAQHYHLHEGEWPHPANQEWLQWTASPPSVVDLDGDGDAEVIGVPNIEMNEPYETQAYGVMVLEGATGDPERAAMRLTGWEELPRGAAPIHVEGWYPPQGIPAPMVVNLIEDERPEIVVSLNDGRMHAFDADQKRLWQFDYRRGIEQVFASEPVAADLNQDGSPEIIFTTYGGPEESDAGQLFVVTAEGHQIYTVELPNPGENGNGIGAPAAPAVGDLNGDGVLEIFVQTFDHGMDVFEVPGSAPNCILWSTSRGGPRRTGAPH